MSLLVPESFSASRRITVTLLLVWLLSAIYMGIGLNRGWGYSDDGTLGQTAERVLHGEMPHRDFNDVYTGGFAYLSAAIFRVVGVNLFALRVLLFAVFLVWVLALYALAAEFTSPWIAGIVTLVA